jgi:hypothetical protein
MRDHTTRKVYEPIHSTSRAGQIPHNHAGLSPIVPDLSVLDDLWSAPPLIKRG